MHIEFNNTVIANMSDWENLAFSDKKAKHWKVGRSAYSLADFVCTKNGINEIHSIVSPIINQDFKLEKGIPEFEARFDKYGHGREHDLAIWGTTETNKKIFIGVESKVDETFGDTIGTAYLKAKTKELNGNKTNAPKRIEKLLENTFLNILESDFKLRYQLLFSLAGTLCVEADIHVLLILVFKTHLYNPELGNINNKDLITFLKRIEAQEINKGYHRALINNKELHIIYKEIECQTQQ